MRSIAGICHSITPVGTRTARRLIAASMLAAVLAAVLAASGDARAERITLVQSDALTQMATETLSQGVMVPFAWEQRVAVVGLGVAGLYLGASTGAVGRSTPRSAVRSAAYRLALPLAGAALGSLVACDSLCDGLKMTAEPLVGAMAGALVAHVLDRDPGAGPEDRVSGDVAAGLVWTPAVSVGVGSYSVGVMGRF
jgi:hypothetical protein